MSGVVIGIIVLVLFAAIGAGVYIAVKQGVVKLPGSTPTPTGSGGTDVDCDYTSGPWDPELCPCGGGTRTRTNTIIREASGDGAPCPPVTETRTCTAPTCAPGVNQDCQFTTTGWQPEVCPCEGGTQTKTNTILSQPAGSGATCPPETQTRQCTGGAGCEARDCEIQYGTWEPAVCPCGGGQQTRTNTIITPASGGGTCPLEVETRDCEGDPCPIDCAYTSTAWTPTTCSCGSTCVQSRTHTITTQPQYGGQECPAPVNAGIEYQNFNGPVCKGNCEGEWYLNIGFGGGSWTAFSWPDYTQQQCTDFCADNTGGLQTRNCRWTKTTP